MLLSISRPPHLKPANDHHVERRRDAGKLPALVRSFIVGNSNSAILTVFRSQCSGGNHGEGGTGNGKAKKHVGRMYIIWSCSWCETEGARLRGEKMNNNEKLEMNGLTDGN